MILTDDEKLAEKARYLTTQAKDDPVCYVHHEIGYNFRLSNIQAALGVAQLEQLPKFLERKREIYTTYKNSINEMDGLLIGDVPNYAKNNHWMNILQIDSKVYGEDPKTLMKRFENNHVQTRPVWPLNHTQKPYRDCQSYKIEKAERLVNKSLCLPSSTNLSDLSLENVILFPNV